jgi:hypothetical protein
MLVVRRSARLGRGQEVFQAAASSKRPCRCGAAREVPWRVAVDRCDARQRVTFWRDGERRPLAVPVQIACAPPVRPQQVDVIARREIDL